MVENYAGAPLVDGYVFLPGGHDVNIHREADSYTTEESRSLPDDEDGTSTASPKLPRSPVCSSSMIHGEPPLEESVHSGRISPRIQPGDCSFKERAQSSGVATSYGCGSDDSGPSVPTTDSSDGVTSSMSVPHLPPLAPIAPGGAPSSPAPLAMAETSLRENLLLLRSAAGEWGKVAKNESAALAVRLQELQSVQHGNADVAGGTGAAITLHGEVDCGAAGTCSVVPAWKLDRSVESALRDISIERRTRARLLSLLRCMSRFNRWMDARLGNDAAIASTWAQFAACGFACCLNATGVLTTASLGPALGMTAGALVVGGLLWNSGLLLVRLTEGAKD